MKHMAILIFITLVGSPAFAETKATTINSAQALVLLKSGNQRFVSGALKHPHQNAARRLETAKGQAPYASVLACSDSRGALDTIFDAGIGDIFTIRVAGNVADTDEIASLEYGAEHLHIPLIVVLGHTSCGAVTAVVKKSELGGQLPGLLDNIQAPAERALAQYGAAAADLVDQTARQNVLQSVQDMLSKSKILSELVEAGSLKIVGGLYHLDTGRVDWVEEMPGQEAWVQAGLKPVSATPVLAEKAPASTLAIPEIAPATTSTNPLFVSLLTLLGSIVVLLLVYKFFVAEKRWVGGLKIKGRMASSYLGILAVLGSAAWISMTIASPWPFVLSIVCALLFTVLFTGAHFESIKTYVRNLRA